ncbi:MAG: class I SAM-dependent methyltransferase [Promethearchaeota archaeon]
MVKFRSKSIPPRKAECEALEDQNNLTMEDFSNIIRKLEMKYRKLIQFILEDLNVKNYSEVLEIGPGPGWIGIWMAQENPTLNITGLELSEDMIRVANKNKIEENVQSRVQYVKGNAENMDLFTDNSFNVVFSNGSLHHWVNPENVFNEISRVLKPNGVFCITDGKRNLKFKAKLKFHILKFTIPKFLRIGWRNSIMASYTKEEIGEILDNTDLKGMYKLKADMQNLIIYNSNT